MLHKKHWQEYWIWDTDLTSAGQFLRSVWDDEFGPTEVQFGRKKNYFWQDSELVM